MTDLSPAAQAVLNAANGAQSYGPDDCLNESRWITAAALRAAADQVVPHEYLGGIDVEVKTRQLTRLRLITIAAELENTNV
jgi:hypothetical protein